MSKIALSDFEVYCPVCTCCLEDHLDECPECLSPRPAGGWEDLSTTSYAYLGKLLDERYVADRFLGAGTTGDVYRGVGSRVRRPFALKIVDTKRYGRKDLQDEMVRRLELEVEAMGRLRNPHVINVYEFLQLRDHLFVLVMDYVEGVTLQERLDRIGRLEAGEALEIIRQVANGLHEAHQRGIIHRDLKPENIMIEQMPASGLFSRILDFGIAYMVDSVRQTSGFRGTPLYASPEQCRSDGEIDSRSDVYSLGCVLYHCLTGSPPYDGERSLAVMEAHIEAPIPSIFDHIDERDELLALDRLVGRMLAKNPAQRPQHCGEVVAALDHLGRPSESPTLRLESSSASSELEEETSELTDTHAGDDADTPSSPRILSQRRQRIVHMVARLAPPDRLDTSRANITAVALGPSGNFALVADRTNTLHMVGVKAHLQTMSFGGADKMLTAVCIDPNRGDVYAGGFECKVMRWDLDRSTGLPRSVVDVSERIFAVDIDRDGARLAIGTERGRVLVYDLRTKQTKLLHRITTPVSALRFVPGGRSLFVGGWDGSMCTVAVSGDEVLATLEPLGSAPIATAISADGSLGAVVEESGQLRLINLFDRSAYLRIEANFANLRALTFDEDNALTGLGVTADHLQLWLVRNENVAQHLAEKSSVGMSESS